MSSLKWPVLKIILASLPGNTLDLCLTCSVSSGQKRETLVQLSGTYFVIVTLLAAVTCHLIRYKGNINLLPLRANMAKLKAYVRAEVVADLCCNVK